MEASLPEARKVSETRAGAAAVVAACGQPSVRRRRAIVIQLGGVATQRGTATLAVRTGGTPVPRDLRGPRGFSGIVVRGGL